MACPIYAALKKFCPHLGDEIEEVRPNMQVSSVEFMRKHGFWPAWAEEEYTSYEASAQLGPRGRECTFPDGSPTRNIPNYAAHELARKLAHHIKEKSK